MNQQPVFYVFKDVEKATNNWNTTTNGIGEGATGQVFKANLNGVDVAVKLLSAGHVNNDLFLKELSILPRLQHTNIVTLVGFAVSDTQRCLIYEFATHDDVEANLRVLNWQHRLRISVEVARGLLYLHTRDPAVIHCDFKPRNVLLDKNLRAVISDFGIARPLLSADMTLADDVMIGTPGFIDPEYENSHVLSLSTDVFAFGIFLIVLLSGEPAFKSDRDPPDMAGLARNGNLDTIISKDVWPNAPVVKELCTLAQQCSLVPSIERLTMNSIAARLEALFSGIEMPETPLEPRQCVICVDRNRKVVLPCEHLLTCEQCALQLIERDIAECPTCRYPFNEFRVVSEGEVVKSFVGETIIEEMTTSEQNSRGNELFSTQNYRQAVYWFRRAASKDHSEAQNSMGVCYEGGKGVIEDHHLAYEWYRKSAMNNNAEGMFNLAVCYDDGDGVEQDYSLAVEWYIKAAGQGHAIAQNNLGVCYDHGKSVVKDHVQAFQWYKLAAEQGYAKGQNNLGLCYRDGEGVDQDHQQSAYWFLKAAENGNLKGMYNTGLCYEIGRGVEMDREKAIEWYRRAADWNHAKAYSSLRRLLYQELE